MTATASEAYHLPLHPQHPALAIPALRRYLLRFRYIGSFQDDRPLRSPAAAPNVETGTRAVAKVSPGQFISQVRTEAAKIVWPTRKETVTTAIMVLIMTTILALFFFGVDAVFRLIVESLLRLVG